jgi:hypothetical protein
MNTFLRARTCQTSNYEFLCIKLCSVICTHHPLPLQELDVAQRVLRRENTKQIPLVGRTPAYAKTCNSQDTMSATWRKERSTVETNKIMKTAAHRSESWCWHQLLSLLSHVLMLVLTQLVCGRPYFSNIMFSSDEKRKCRLPTVSDKEKREYCTSGHIHFFLMRELCIFIDYLRSPSVTHTI